jgi:hypothetical protein
MTMLRKNMIRNVIPGSPGQTYFPTQQARPGYWATTQVVTTGCIPSLGSMVVSKVGWRIASYDEIANYLCNDWERQSKCRVVKKQMETLYNTKFLFENVGDIDRRSFLAVAIPPNAHGLAICVVDREATDWELTPTPVVLPVGYNRWLFSDWYECEIVNGVEVVTAI